MQPTPLYQPSATGGAYQLRYAWTGWPSRGKFSEPPPGFIDGIKPEWQRDGLKVLEHRWTDEMVQVVFSATPAASPEFIAARSKGRIDHALRQAGIDCSFSRKVAIRTVGDNTRADLESYLSQQVAHERFVDPRFEKTMEELAFVDERVDLSLPAESARGRYWYNLHLVFATAEHEPIHDLTILRSLKDAFIKVAAKKGHLLARLSVMPDHVHAMLRPLRKESPLETVFAYQNNLAHIVGRRRIWSDGYYVGTFSEYTMNAIRKHLPP